MSDKSNRLLLVDLDGTLLLGNSLPRYLVVAVGWWKLLVGLPMLLLRWIALVLHGKMQSGKLKEALFFNYLRGQSRETLEQWGELSVKQQLLPILNPGVKKPMDEAMAQGDTVFLVTASLDFWVKPLANHLGCGYLCTMAEYNAQAFFTGRFATPNCKYGEKKRRVLEQFDLNAISRVVAYGNSNGDAGMFELAHDVWWVERNGRVVCLKKAE
jgi:phosphatidylglycerophosphatase C